MYSYTVRNLVLGLLIIFGLQANAAVHSQDQTLTVFSLKAEYETKPIGIDDLNPRLSWEIKNPARNTFQTAYRVQVAKNKKFADEGIVWDTGKTESGQSIHISYNGSDLESGQRYYWRVRVWDNHGNQSGWSPVSYWEMGLLSSQHWQAKWIEPTLEEDVTKSQPSPLLRTEFALDKEIISARAYVTSHGLYEMKINGERVGDQVFTPGWTSYKNRLQYQTYDVTDLLKAGQNAVGVVLGDGWYRGYIGFGGQRNFYGDKLGLLAQLEITYADGRKQVIGTDENWKASTGPILKSDIYNGEFYDARLEKDGWTTTGYDDSDWHKVRLADHGKEKLIARDGPPIRKIQELKPVGIFTSPEGDTIADMGQNMVGWVRLNVEGPAGTKVTLQHAEVLDKEGNFYTENLRAAEQKNTYVLKGDGAETYEPHFTFQGFRYVKVEGYPGELSEEDLTGVVIHSDMEPTGHFESSNPLLNQLQHNIVWGQKGNFLDVPTDCPQRDERLGWTGDIQVFAQTACYNMDAAGFLSKWLGDLEADQLDNGSIPHVVPNVLGDDWSGASGWADAGVIVPWTLYQVYGDVQILERQYESMKAWVNYMKDQAQSDGTPYLWDSDFTFGDWLSFNSTASDYPGAYTDKNLISTAYFAHSTDLLQRTAEILGNREDAERYGKLLARIKKAFQNEYLTPNGRVMSNTQTSYLLALQFDLLTEDLKSKAVRHLVSRINERGHLTTGFLGTPQLNPALSQYGYGEQAFELLLRKEYPSWLYPVTMGATTIWERWDGIKPDSSFQDAGMNSYNHYAYGAIGEWLYQTVAGIKSVKPGYKQIAIQPTPGGGLTYARSMIHTMYGKIESSWKVENDRFSLAVDIPENTTAFITLPDAAGEEIAENDQKLASGDGILQINQEGDEMVIEVGSGEYNFSYQANNLISESGSDEHSGESGAYLNTGSKIGELIADPHTRELLYNHASRLMESPWVSQVMGFSVSESNNALPAELRISEKEMDLISRDLNSLSTK